LSWLCFSCASACLVLTCPVCVAGVVGWCARHGVGEAHGRGGRAVCGGERGWRAADCGRLEDELAGAGKAGRGLLPGDATAGGVRRAQAVGCGGGGGRGAGRPPRHAGRCGHHRRLLAAGFCGGHKQPLSERGLSPWCVYPLCACVCFHSLARPHVSSQASVWRIMRGSRQARSTRTCSTWAPLARARAASSSMQTWLSRRVCGAGSSSYAASGAAS
jgi:hypothetical protein